MAKKTELHAASRLVETKFEVFGMAILRKEPCLPVYFHEVVMVTLNAAQRLISMSFKKSDIESSITGLADQIFQHLGYAFTLKISPELEKEWADEIEDKYLARIWWLSTKIKKGKRLSEEELTKWVAEGASGFQIAAKSAFRDKDYKTIPKRFRSVDRALNMAQEVNLQKFVKIISNGISLAKTPHDLEEVADRLMKALLSEALTHADE